MGEVSRGETIAWGRGFDRGSRSTWDVVRSLHGLQDCTIRNTSAHAILTFSVKPDEGYIDLAPGEEVTLRTVEA